MKEPIRILNIVGEMSPGGIETLIMNIYRNIDRNKIQFDFLQHSPSGKGSFNKEIELLGGKIHHMPYIRTQNKTYYWKLFSYIKALKKFFREHQEYHVIHGHMTNTAAIYMPIAKKYGAVTCCIAHSHLTQARPGLVGKITDILHKPISKIATDYFACSEMAAHWIFSEKDILVGKVKIIKNGVDPKRFFFDENKRKEVRKKLGIENQLVIGNVARFKTEKNHSFQIDVFKEVYKQRQDSILLLVGDGELKTNIENKVRILGLEDKVKFLGIRSDISELMLAMDLFFLPSIYEGLPVVAVEAQASGLPVLTSSGVTKETDITGNVTFMNLEENIEKWADKIIEITSNFKRNDMSRYIQENGYDIIETSKWLEKFYLEKHLEYKKN